jgi:hypothetical protein
VFVATQEVVVGLVDARCWRVVTSWRQIGSRFEGVAKHLDRERALDASEHAHVDGSATTESPSLAHLRSLDPAASLQNERAVPWVSCAHMGGSDLLGVAMIVMMGAMVLGGRSLFRHWRRH